MNSGKLFWGFFFVTIGILIFAAKFNWFELDWDFVWDLWPLILILWGGIILARKTIIKPFFAILFGIVTALIIYGGISNVLHFNFWNNDWDRRVEWRDSQNQYVVDYDDSISKAKLNLSAGAGKIIIRKTSHDLLSGYSRGERVKYRVDTRTLNDAAYIDFEMRSKKFRPFDDDLNNTLLLSLNDNPTWEMEFKIGAAKAIFELEEFKIDELTLKTGATDIDLRLGDKSDRTNINVEMGAANLEIAIPRKSGCQISGKMFLSGKEFKGFNKVNNAYETENFTSADKKIVIDVRGAVSNVEVRRY
ncbi:MAG TPA: hypothetical protein ENN33_03075 [Ignavibacteria bacterium]|mgnify:CR=1 FL=1|nr:hypothetical protein [Ignavibacteria bacterium]